MIDVNSLINVSNDIFLQLSLIVILAAIAALILRLFKQPHILAYILVGILITPIFKVITNTNIIESISTIGIAFLLFIVGMEMDFKKLKNVALVSTGGGLIQIVILFFIGFLASLLLGYTNIEAVYIALLISFSSTMLVIKLLSDNREINTLHGRIVVGILVVQDIVAILALSILASIDGFNWALMGIALFKFGALFGVAYLCSKFIFPWLFKFAAEYQELLLITSLAVCFSFSVAASYLGFSIAIGAFIAGLTLGNLEYNLDIMGKVKSLKDFFSMLFFVSLGMSLSLGVIKQQWVPLVVITLLVILVKPTISVVICILFKYTKKPAFLTSISLAQIGEFSLILAAQGLLLGHISNSLFSVVVVVTLFTMVLSTYSIKYDNWLYNIFERPLGMFDSFTSEGMEFVPTEVKPKIILCGHNRIGYSILEELKSVKKEVLIVDYNPEMISHLMKEGYHCIYGDVADEEIVEKMNLKQIFMLISTVPEVKDSQFIIRKVKAVNPKAKVIVTASDIDESTKLYSAGADYVILPHFLGGEHVAKLITKVRTGEIKLHEEKKHHLLHLKERKERGQEHPKT
jgi:Kef-type K+ transport system membrane component KefB